MLNLSKEISQALLNYLIGQLSLAQFRDLVVGIRLEKYESVPDVDRAFLDEFEGRYAEFSDFGKDEMFLRKSLVAYVFSDDASAAPRSQAAYFFLFHGESPSGSQSMSIGLESKTRNLSPQLSPA
jgi:hypothetical protein